MTEYGFDYSNEELHPLTQSIEDQLIAEEQGVEEFWSMVADRVATESVVEPAATGIDPIIAQLIA